MARSHSLRSAKCALHTLGTRRSRSRQYESSCLGADSQLLFLACKSCQGVQPVYPKPRAPPKHPRTPDAPNAAFRHARRRTAGRLTHQSLTSLRSALDGSLDLAWITRPRPASAWPSFGSRRPCPSARGSPGEGEGKGGGEGEGGSRRPCPSTLGSHSSAAQRSRAS